MTQKLSTILEREVALRVAQQIRAQYAPWFALADEAHRVAAEVLPQLEPPKTSNTRLLAAVLFGRILTSFQSIYVLTERGLCGDARTLIRATAESTIVLAALAADPEGVVELLVARNVVNERKMLSAWLEDPQAADYMTPEQRERFAAHLKESLAKYPNVKRDPVDIHKLARSTGLLWLYNTAYRMHSSDAAHTSVLALERHVKANESAEITELQFGSNLAEVRDTLSNAVVPLLNATHTVISFFGLMHYKADLDKVLAAWQALCGSKTG